MMYRNLTPEEDMAFALTDRGSLNEFFEETGKTCKYHPINYHINRVKIVNKAALCSVCLKEKCQRTWLEECMRLAELYPEEEIVFE